MTLLNKFSYKQQLVKVKRPFVAERGFLPEVGGGDCSS